MAFLWTRLLNSPSEGPVERGVPPGTSRPDCSRIISSEECYHVEFSNINQLEENLRATTIDRSTDQFDRPSAAKAGPFDDLL